MDSTDSAILEYLDKHDGALARDIAKHLNKPIHIITSHMGELARKAEIVRIPEKNGDSRGVTYRYYSNKCAFSQATRAFLY